MQLLVFLALLGQQLCYTTKNAMGVDVCAGHNDLQCGNILMPCSTPGLWNQTASSSSDAGHSQADRHGSFKLIDYDYACWSNAGFDIANHWWGDAYSIYSCTWSQTSSYLMQVYAQHRHKRTNASLRARTQTYVPVHARNSRQVHNLIVSAVLPPRVSHAILDSHHQARPLL